MVDNTDENSSFEEDEPQLLKRSLSLPSDGEVSPIFPPSIERSASEGGRSRSELKSKFFNISKIITLSKWWRNKTEEISEKRKRKEQTEELKMRYKLKYHFMTPFEKYKRGRKPWKLLIQIIKIIVVTTQVMLFGSERFTSVAFVKHTKTAFKNLFIRGYDELPTFSYYSREELADAILFANKRFNTVENVSIGIYWHGSDRRPLTFCVEIYNTSSSAKVDLSGPTELECSVGLSYNRDDLLNQFNERNYFSRVKGFFLYFEIYSVFINGLSMHHKAECYSLNNTIYIDNSKHDGKLMVSFEMDHKLQPKCPNELKESPDAKKIREFYIGFDVLVITLCTVSLLLCTRSVVKSIKLATVAQKYFKEYKGEEIKHWDLFELINKWFIVIVLSDLLSIIGSLYKIRVDYRDIDYYNICSIFLGIGVLLVWVGILRFFTYVPKCNILLIALYVAAPNLLRFMFCALFMFFGFTVCGWVVLGPYHEKFTTFSRTSDCLYSLLNGDDMFPTFNSMSKSNLPIWIFSKLYLYSFISLFIYVVLSTFISIVGDSYERIKDMGRMPPSRIESFIAGSGSDSRLPVKPAVQIGSSDGSFAEEGPSFSTYGSFTHSSELSTSQLSVMSASLE